ncbi:MAG: acyltransferase [Ignavibacteriae bacterium]|nr:acyltransferase [Ignavibacteriota bacterium]NOG98154.1 acyltransferase [Ignavibacteriota bacterium]
MVKKKDLRVETLRGIAIIMVVITHVIGGLKFETDCYWNYVASSLQFLRMPLFTVISGYVYAYKPVMTGNERMFIKGKARRLLITFALLTPLYFILRIVFPTNFTPDINDIVYVYVFPKAGLWYLQALFFIFVIILILEYKNVLSKFLPWLIISVFSFLLFFFYNSVPNAFSLRGTLYLLPYFLLGLGLNRFEKEFKNIHLNYLFLFVFITSFTLLQYNIHYLFGGNSSYHYKFSLIPVLSAITLILLLFQINFNNKMLSWLGNYSYSIFLYHVLFCISFRIVQSKLGIENPFILVAGCTLPGLIFPIVLEKSINKSAILKLLLLGKSNKKAKNRSIIINFEGA